MINDEDEIPLLEGKFNDTYNIFTLDLGIDIDRIYRKFITILT